MYLDFYGFKEKPFELAPDPRFLYLGENHKEALALLTYGVKEHKGFVLLTGEVGTGKTTMVRALLNNLSQSVRHVSLTNPALNPDDFLHYIAFSLGLDASFKTKWEFLVQFETFLKEAYKKKENIVLIVDEAQTLSHELLEELRLLSNMETDNQKLLNIFLVGQPELNSLLRQPKCRALVQRISIRHHINPLTLQETADYIKTRVEAARGSRDLFCQKAIKTIYVLSKGYPRVINILCDNVLLYGYVEGKKKITPEMIATCHKEMELPLPRPASIESENTVQAESPGNKEKEKHAQVRNVHRNSRSLLWITLSVILVIIVALVALNTESNREMLQRAKAFFQSEFTPEIRDQMTEVRGQMTEVRGQMTEVIPLLRGVDAKRTGCVVRE